MRPLMVVPGNSFCLSNTLIFEGGLQHHALIRLVDEIALHFRPERLARWIGKSVLLQIDATWLAEMAIETPIVAFGRPNGSTTPIGHLGSLAGDIVCRAPADSDSFATMRRNRPAKLL